MFHQYQEFWGQGLASGAAGAILRYAFEQLNITRLIYAFEKS